MVNDLRIENAGKINVLDTMAAAHIYHDSLFLARRRPDLCLLLLPGDAEAESLEKDETWAAYGVGAISNYSVGATNVQRCVVAISARLHNTCNEDPGHVGSGT